MCIGHTFDAYHFCVRHGAESREAAMAIEVWRSVGNIGYLVELFFGVAIAVFGAIGVLRCCGWKSGNLGTAPIGTAPIEEQYNLSLDERRARDGDFGERDAEVTIRLEDRYLRRLHRHRCVVTIHNPLGSAESTGREVWYARDAPVEK